MFMAPKLPVVSLLLICGHFLVISCQVRSGRVDHLLSNDELQDNATRNIHDIEAGLELLTGEDVEPIMGGEFAQVPDILDDVLSSRYSSASALMKLRRSISAVEIIHVFQVL